MGSTPQSPDSSGKIRRPADRPRRKKVEVVSHEAHVIELGALAELMLGAAWADGNKVAVEIVAIAEQLKEYVDTTSLPEHVSHLMERFDPAHFDIAATCARLRFDGDEDRLAVMQLLAHVVGADRVLHPAEDRYLRTVAATIGLDPTTLSIQLT